MREELTACFQDTVKKSGKGKLRRLTARAVRSSRIYKEGFVSEVGHRSENAAVEVHPGTTFDIAKKYRSLGKIAVLNFANPEHPGGGVQFGAMAQEECLCRSSNLFSCISASRVFDEYYGYHQSGRNPFSSDRLIYTKNVTVFKDDGIIPEMLPEKDWFTVDVITCAAPYIGNRKHMNGTALLSLFMARIQNIFEAARDNGADYLILGAFGCGAFKNPPLIAAEAFRRTIREQNYFRDFKKIVFAIKKTEANCSNFNTFYRLLDGYSLDDEEDRSSAYFERRLRRNPKLPDENRFADDREFALWQLNNRYFGKQFSVFGDSVSTLDGYNPRGYSVFYADENCERSGVIAPQDTWWDKVIGFFGGELLVNNSWSGSRVTGKKENGTFFPSGCSDERTSSLHIHIIKPDVIMVYLGINDWAYGVKTGKEPDIYGENENEFFDKAYNSMLKKIRTNYPESEVWCCTLCETYISKKPAFKFPHKYAGIHIEEFNEIIRDAAKRNGCRLIDLYSYKTAYDSMDGTHPTKEGMNTVASLIIRSVVDSETARFLD